MATFYDDIDEIHSIILDIPYESDGSIQSWEDIDEEDSDDLPEAENSPNQLLADVSDENEQMSSSQNRVAAPSRKRVAQPREKVPEINWGQMDEVTNVDYPEFLGPEHGPVEDFAVDSEPVIFFDQPFTDELWNLLVTETNRYATQARVNNWQDTNRDEMRCFTGFLFGTSINKISQLDDIWSSDWVLSSPAFTHFFTRNRFWALFANIHLADNQRAVCRDHKDYDKLYKIRPMMS